MSTEQARSYSNFFLRKKYQMTRQLRPIMPMMIIQFQKEALGSSAAIIGSRTFIP